MRSQARHLTVRGLPAGLAKALQEEKRQRGVSLNQVVIDVLSDALGVGGRTPFDNGLGELAGGWSKAEHEAFEKAVACFEEIDEDMWR
jgi:hypothetical protein